MSTTTWDPLAASLGDEVEIRAATLKRQIRNILKSYVGMYDPFSELVQNAMDAVDRRMALGTDASYKRYLWITVSLADNSFAVTDNGIGFNEKELRSFLAPNISFKDGVTSRGSKGVGATYIAYGFDHLQFATKGNGHEFIGEIEGGRTWLDDQQGISTRPVVTAIASIDTHFSKLDRGASFRITFKGKNDRPKDLSWYQATTADQWLHLLLTKTPLGSVHPKESAGPILFSLDVIDKTGKKTSVENVPARYMFPHTLVNASLSLKEVLEVQQKLASAGQDASKLPQRFYRSNGLYEHMTMDDLSELVRVDDALQIVRQYNASAYAYFAYSTSIWDQLNDSIAKLRKGYRFLKGGLQLANNGMIQGELIVIPLTSDTGYQNQAHIVIHFEGADPDLGRKGFQPELKEAAETLSIAIVNRFKRWRKLLKSDDGGRPDIAKELDLHEWIKQQEHHAEHHPLTIANKNFFAPSNEISIASTPQSEQDVIVLFNQLVAGGVIRGISLLATSQTKQYDGVFRFVAKAPFDYLVFERNNNPLGIPALNQTTDFATAPKVLEYKYNLDGLIREFENGDKTARDIHLAVVWEIGTEWKRSYEAISLLDLDNIHQRDYHGVTHVLRSSHVIHFVIALRELVDYLNDVSGVQSYHKETYG